MEMKRNEFVYKIMQSQNVIAQFWQNKGKILPKTTKFPLKKIHQNNNRKKAQFSPQILGYKEPEKGF